ncbi:hypothetical protein ACIQGW_15880 [Lysinibacillus xylanilyticus]|uniref:hypothetical protein n=1 Tax=Lysinibacillus xylanilyticus TaxID=582475 RepID=UPI0038149BB3
MSFASVILTKEFVVVTSDGQITNTESLEVMAEGYQKFGELTKYQYMVATGSVNVMESVYKLCKKKIKNSFESCNLKEMSLYIKHILNQHIEQGSCAIILCGFDKESNPELYFIHSDITNIESHILCEDNWLFRFLPSDHLQIEVNDVIAEFSNLIETRDFKNSENLVDILNEINSLVAKYDISVNNNFYHTVIDRKKSIKELILGLLNKTRRIS